MYISIAQTLNCAVSFTGYLEIQTEGKGNNMSLERWASVLSEA